MAGIYFGAGGVKKVKNIYFGAGGVKKVKKAWIGVNGVPKLFYNSEPTMTYYKQLTLTNSAVTCGTYNSNNAMVVYANNGEDFFNPSLTKINRTNDLGATYTTLGYASTPSYNLTAGGSYVSSNSGGTPNNRINAFNSNLTHTTASLNTSVKGAYGAGLGNYAFWVGGVLNLGYSSIIQATNNNLTTSTCSSLSSTRSETCVGSVGNYMLVFGGRIGSDLSFTSAVEVYNSSLTKCSNATSLSYAHFDHEAASNSSYVIAAGGYYRSSGSQYSSYAYAYNTNLTQTATWLSYAPNGHSGISTDGIAIFAGGYPSSYFGATNTINYFNTSLVRTVPSVSGDKHGSFCGASIGDYVLLAGGTNGSYHDGESYVNTIGNKVDIYSLY